jgi:hypothetical protein
VYIEKYYIIHWKAFQQAEKPEQEQRTASFSVDCSSLSRSPEQIMQIRWNDATLSSD